MVLNGPVWLYIVHYGPVSSFMVRIGTMVMVMYSPNGHVWLYIFAYNPV